MNLDNKSIFDSLTESAFEFLENSLDQIKENPKSSIINFATSVELFLKARLVAEHWTLIVSKPDAPNINDVRSGNFRSISVADAIKLIEGVLNFRIKKEYYNKIVDIKNHRNKIIHFYHDKIDDNKEIEHIAIEQFVTWKILKRWIYTDWMNIFANYHKKLDEIENKLVIHEKYLDAIFDAQKDEIKEKIKIGYKFIDCEKCGRKSLELEKIYENIFFGNCWVCNNNEDNYVGIVCPDCSNNVLIGPYGGKGCDKCGCSLGAREILEIICEPINISNNRRGRQRKYAYCTECGGKDCVGYIGKIKGSSYYLCANCLEFSNVIKVCEYCGSFNVGWFVNSGNFSGCGYCVDGEMGFK